MPTFATTELATLDALRASTMFDAPLKSAKKSVTVKLGQLPLLPKALMTQLRLRQVEQLVPELVDGVSKMLPLEVDITGVVTDWNTLPSVTVFPPSMSTI